VGPRAIRSSDAIRSELCKLGSCDAHGVPVKRPERASLLKTAGATSRWPFL